MRPNTSIDDAIMKMRNQPLHFIRFKEKIKQKMLKSPDRHKPTNNRTLTEDIFFEDDETITVYLDFLNIDFIKGNSTQSIQEINNRKKKHRHNHEFFELGYVYSGSCTYFIESKEITLPAGSLFIVNTKVYHSILMNDESTNLVNILVRSTEFNKTLLQILNPDNLFYKFFANSIYNPKVTSEYMHFSIEKGSMIEFYLHSIIKENVKYNNSSQSIMLYLFCCLLEELSLYYKENKRVQEQQKLDLSDILNYINNNYATVTLQDLSKRFHYSSHYITEFLYKQTGKRFQKIVNQTRLDKSKEMLLDTDLSIDTIASSLGYKYRSSFENAFKNEFKITPVKYRKTS